MKMAPSHRMDTGIGRRGFFGALVGLGVAGVPAGPARLGAMHGTAPQCPHCFAMLEPPYGKTPAETRELFMAPRDMACGVCKREVYGVRFVTAT
jgi:hypothetical protein